MQNAPFVGVHLSSSKVGYQTKDAISGFQMVTPSFKNLATESYPIDKFTVQGATDGMTSIQVLDENGLTKGMYYWYNEFVDGDTTYPAGWFDALGVESANISLESGVAVFFYTEESGVTIQSAGEVPGEITKSISGYVMFGNGSPVSIDVDEMTVQGATDGMTSIQVLDANGLTDRMYYWYNEFTDGGTTYPAGWFDALGVEPANIKLEPGAAVFFYSEEANVSATVPSAL